MDFDFKIYNFISDCQNYVLTQDESKKARLLAFPDNYEKELKTCLADYRNIRYVCKLIFTSPVINPKQLVEYQFSPDVLTAMLSVLEKLEKHMYTMNIPITQEIVLHYTANYYDEKDQVTAFGRMVGKNHENKINAFKSMWPTSLDFLSNSTYQKEFTKPEPVINFIFRQLNRALTETYNSQKAKEDIEKLLVIFTEHYLIPTHSVEKIKPAIKNEYDSHLQKSYEYFITYIDKYLLSKNISLTPEQTNEHHSVRFKV